MEIPEFVYGIPTPKGKSKERVGLIKDYYSMLWKKLQKEGRNNSDHKHIQYCINKVEV